MKLKFILTAAIVLSFCNFISAQTSTLNSDNLSIGSYKVTAPGDIIVYPYIEIQNSAQTSKSAAAEKNAPKDNGAPVTTGLQFNPPQGYIDQSIYYKIKKGTDFYLTKIINVNGTIIGYVIKVWDFQVKDYKEEFYKTLGNTTKESDTKTITGGNVETYIRVPKDSLKLNNTSNKYEISSLAGFLSSNQSSGNGHSGLNYKKLKKDNLGVDPPTPSDPNSEYAKYVKLAYLDSWANDKLFFISAADFAPNTATVYPASNNFTWGFLTLPLKVRFDNNRHGIFDFEQNLNFGLTLGAKHQFVSHENVSLNYLFGVSVVNAPLNDASPATPEIPATATTPEIPAKAASPATTAPALSFSFGSMFQYDKFQIGLFIGKDFVGDNAYKFAYQGKPWIGIAIGVSLFGEGQTTATGQSQTTK